MQKRWYEFVPKSWVCLFKEPYRFTTFRKDLTAGVTVGIVSLPLAMAFAIASGVSPERGIFTAVVAGFFISLLGGSRVQIGGPTGAFVVIVYDVVARQGYDGLVVATLIAALLLIAAGLCRIGTWIKFIPYPLITGLMTGIGLVLFSSQVKDFLGLKITDPSVDFIPKWKAIFGALPTFDPMTFAVAGGTLVLILCIRRFMPRIPWGIASIIVATLVVWGFDFQVDTITSRFGQIPRMLPLPSLPALHFTQWHMLVPDAITIAFLAGVESLLSAVVADGMMGTRHKSNCELIGQGIGNLGSSLFGGIPATGAIARTAINIKTGARTPLAGMVHAITVFLIVLAFAPIVGKIPMPALAAVLVMIAWNMSEVERFRSLLKAPLGDVAVLLLAFFTTVLVDITVAVEVGMILAAFLFMKRTSDLSNVVTVSSLLEENGVEKRDPEAISKKKIPTHVEVYEINGPFFFGVADSLQKVLVELEPTPKVFILRMRKVPAIDATGLHALEDFYDKCKRSKTVLILSGAKGALAEALKKSGIEKKVGKQNMFAHIDEALIRADELVQATSI
jgi:SulP family sulfate permease